MFSTSHEICTRLGYGQKVHDHKRSVSFFLAFKIKFWKRVPRSVCRLVHIPDSMLHWTWTEDTSESGISQSGISHRTMTAVTYHPNSSLSIRVHRVRNPEGWSSSSTSLSINQCNLKFSSSCSSFHWQCICNLQVSESASTKLRWAESGSRLSHWPGRLSQCWRRAYVIDLI